MRWSPLTQFCIGSAFWAWYLQSLLEIELTQPTFLVLKMLNVALRTLECALANWANDFCHGLVVANLLWFFDKLNPVKSTDNMKDTRAGKPASRITKYIELNVLNDWSVRVPIKDRIVWIGVVLTKKVAFKNVYLKHFSSAYVINNTRKRPQLLETCGFTTVPKSAKC